MNGEQETSNDVVTTTRLPASRLPQTVRHLLAGAVPGQRRPSGQVSPSVLDRHLPAGAEPEPAPPAAVTTETVDLAPVAGTEDAVAAASARARAALSMTPGPGLLPHTVAVRVDVDVDGRITAATHRTGWRAVRDGASAFLVTEVVPVPVTARPVVEALEACSLGRSYVDLREGVFATRLELSAPLHPGAAQGSATGWTLHRIVPGGDPVPAVSHECRLDGPVDDVRLEVVFDPRRLPRSGEAFVAVGGRRDAVPVAVREGSLRWSGSVTDGGVVGLRWAW